MAQTNSKSNKNAQGGIQAASGTNQSSGDQIGQKNLTMLQEQLMKEALLYKKCNVSAAQFNDAKLKSLASRIALHHKQRFDALFNYLNSH